MRAARPREIALVLAILALVVAGIWVLTRPDAQVVSWTKWSVADDQRTITLTYQGTSCDDHADVDVVEEELRVVLTLRVTPRMDGCDDSVRKTIDVTLSEPLGRRTVAHGPG